MLLVHCLILTARLLIVVNCFKGYSVEARTGNGQKDTEEGKEIVKSCL